MALPIVALTAAEACFSVRAKCSCFLKLVSEALNGYLGAFDGFGLHLRNTRSNAFICIHPCGIPTVSGHSGYNLLISAQCTEGR